MPEEPAQQSPEILKQIQDAERKVERMLRSAEQEASVVIEKARAQAEALLGEKRQTLAERTRLLVAEGIDEAEQEAERIISQARVKSNDLKQRCMARLDEAAEFVLGRILPKPSSPPSPPSSRRKEREGAEG